MVGGRNPWSDDPDPAPSWTEVGIASYRLEGEDAIGDLTLTPTPSDVWRSACDLHLERFRQAFQADAALTGDGISYRVAAHDLDRSQLALLHLVAHVDRTVQDLL